MATSSVVRTETHDAVIYAWLAVPNGNVGQAVELNDYADRSVQVGGTFGAGGSVSLKGSNDATNYIVLADPQGNALTKTSAAIEQVLEATRMFRPEVTAGDGTTAIDVYLYCRRSFR